ncbi:HK97 family phage prohead protease [Azospirillum sp.]|uniref:HK97 family phage prohead protease n=1 Tax=Azospirillum sp. TaxID=34012 RepID=UPI003D75035B
MLREPDGEKPADLEVRFAVDIEMRAVDDTARTLQGYAAAFNVKTKIRSWSGEFEEVLEPACFADTLAKQADVRALVEHDYRSLLARTSAGNLVLEEDARGLKFSMNLPDTQLGRDTYENVRVRNYTGMSFGFMPLKMKQDFDERGRLVRVSHQSVDLREITITSMPAYPKTSVAIRSLITRSASLLPGSLDLRLRIAKLRA